MRRTNDPLVDLLVGLMEMPTSLIKPAGYVKSGMKEMDAMMRDGFDEISKASKEAWQEFDWEYIKSDVIKRENGITIKAVMPGFKKEDISVDVEDDHLVIAGERKEEVEEKDTYIRKEIRTGKYRRVFGLDGYDKESIKAKYEDGILYVDVDEIEKEPVFQKKINID